MSYTFGNLAALGIARCSRGRNRNDSWLTIYQVTLVAAETFLVGLAAEAKAIGIFVQEFLALSAVDYFISHNIHCFCFFRARTINNTRQTSRKGRNRGQNARTRRSVVSYSLFIASNNFCFDLYVLSLYSYSMRSLDLPWKGVTP